MPSVVKQNLNQCIRASLSAAEVIGSPRGFAGLAVNNLASQKLLISGIIYSVLITTAADKPNITGVLSIQRGLVLTAQTIFPAVENPEEMVFQFFFGGNSTADVAKMPQWIPALELEGGYPYAVSLSLSPSAVIAGSVVISLTVQGRQAPASGGPEFPFVQR